MPQTLNIWYVTAMPQTLNFNQELESLVAEILSGSVHPASKSWDFFELLDRVRRVELPCVKEPMLEVLFLFPTLARINGHSNSQIQVVHYSDYYVLMCLEALYNSSCSLPTFNNLIILDWKPSAIGTLTASNPGKWCQDSLRAWLAILAESPERKRLVWYWFQNRG